MVNLATVRAGITTFEVSDLRGVLQNDLEVDMRG